MQNAECRMQNNRRERAEIYGSVFFA